MPRRPLESWMWTLRSWSPRTTPVSCGAGMAPATTITPRVSCRSSTSKVSCTGPSHCAAMPLARASVRSPMTPSTRKPASGWVAMSSMMSAASALAPTMTTRRQ